MNLINAWEFIRACIEIDSPGLWDNLSRAVNLLPLQTHILKVPFKCPLYLFQTIKYKLVYIVSIVSVKHDEPLSFSMISKVLEEGRKIHPQSI